MVRRAQGDGATIAPGVRVHAPGYSGHVPGRAHPDHYSITYTKMTRETAARRADNILSPRGGGGGDDASTLVSEPHDEDTGEDFDWWKKKAFE